ncbi:MAG: response regulator [Lachnospiraceae bacterium]|nr:response regulator [Lachnospiraceae bacterium]
MDRSKVMIIDDNIEVLTLMKSLLGPVYDVAAYTSGEEALIALSGSEEKPRLILLDISMQGMDGYEVLKRLKEDDENKRIPVVFLTGMTDESSECKGLEADVVDYLKKPVPGKVLLARVQRYIDLYGDQPGKGKLDENKLKDLTEPLSERELEVARLMGEFRSDREICDLLYISMPYAKKLVASVKGKLGLDKRGDIRRYLL